MLLEVFRQAGQFHINKVTWQGYNFIKNDYPFYRKSFIKTAPPLQTREFVHVLLEFRKMGHKRAEQ